MQARTGWALAMALTIVRLLLAPGALWITYASYDTRWIAVCLIAGFLSDVFDGIIARQANASTAGLRLADSLVDTVFYLAIAAAAWMTYPEALRLWRAPIALLIVAEFANYGASLAKFGKGASYHAWSAKAMGAALFGGCLFLFAYGSTLFLPVAILIGLLAQCEVAAITWTLPAWHHDVRSVIHARRIRDSSAP